MVKLESLLLVGQIWSQPDLTTSGHSSLPRFWPELHQASRIRESRDGLYVNVLKNIARLSNIFCFLS
jgi:hypothetical protein